MDKVRQRPESDPPIYHRLEKTYASRVAQIDQEWPDSIDIVLQAFRIGDHVIASAPFEVFAETGLEIKDKSPFQHTFIIELANGEYGYLRSEERRVGKECRLRRALYHYSKIERSVREQAEESRPM